MVLISPISTLVFPIPTMCSPVFGPIGPWKAPHTLNSQQLNRLMSLVSVSKSSFLLLFDPEVVKMVLSSFGESNSVWFTLIPILPPPVMLDTSSLLPGMTLPTTGAPIISAVTCIFPTDSTTAHWPNIIMRFLLATTGPILTSSTPGNTRAYQTIKAFSTALASPMTKPTSPPTIPTVAPRLALTSGPS